MEVFVIIELPKIEKTLELGMQIRNFKYVQDASNASSHIIDKIKSFTIQHHGKVIAALPTKIIMQIHPMHLEELENDLTGYADALNTQIAIGIGEDFKHATLAVKKSAKTKEIEFWHPETDKIEEENPDLNEIADKVPEKEREPAVIPTLDEQVQATSSLYDGLAQMQLQQMQPPMPPQGAVPQGEPQSQEGEEQLEQAEIDPREIMMRIHDEDKVEMDASKMEPAIEKDEDDVADKKAERVKNRLSGLLATMHLHMPKIAELAEKNPEAFKFAMKMMNASLNLAKSYKDKAPELKKGGLPRFRRGFFKPVPNMIRDGRISVDNKDAGRINWRGVRSGLMMGPDGNPLSTRTHNEISAGNELGKEELEKAPIVFEGTDKKPYTEITRWENKEGKGPYHAPFNQQFDMGIESHSHPGDKAHPTPLNDEGFTSDDLDSLSPIDHKFGFENKDQQTQWFSPEEQKKLKEYGYKPKKIKASKVWSSGRQAFFEKYVEPKRKLTKKNESDSLEKMSRPKVTFPKLESQGVHSRPDQEVSIIDTPRQKELFARKLVNDRKAPFGLNAEREHQVKRTKPKNTTDKGGPVGQHRMYPQSNSKQQKGFAYALGAKSRKEGTTTPDQVRHVGSKIDSTVNHEALHYSLGQIGQRYGDQGRQKVVAHLLDQAFDKKDPAAKEAKTALLHYITKGKGYRNAKAEEMLTHIRDLTASPSASNDFNWHQRMHNRQNKTREYIQHYKRALSRMVQAAKQVGPDFFNEE